MLPIRSLFNRSFRKLGQLSIAAVLVGTAISHPANAQISFGSPIELGDNDANQGSPTLIELPDSKLALYFVNHSNNTIYVDIGLTGSVQSTGIVVNAAELTDVGVCEVNGSVLLSYISTTNNATFALSSNGVSFNAGVVPTAQSLGLPSGVAVNTAFVPALVSNGYAYVATVGTNGYVYTAYSPTGTSFTPAIGSGVSVSSYTTVSRPSLAVWKGSPYVGFTNPPSREAIVGGATSQGAQPVLQSSVYWGNSNRDGHYAGVALVASGNDLYVFGQDTGSSQQLKYIYTQTGGIWMGSYNVGNQMRWTPSLAMFTGEVYLAYQDDGDTNISYRVSP